MRGIGGARYEASLLCTVDSQLVACAFISHNDDGIPLLRDNEHGLFESRVRTCQVGDVRKVFRVAIDGQM